MHLDYLDFLLSKESNLGENLLFFYRELINKFNLDEKNICIRTIYNSIKNDL